MKKDSADGRRLMWKIAGRAIAENPWGGCGLGYFGGAFGKAQAAYFATEEATEQEEWVAGSPEYGFNEYLQLGVELGIVGSIFNLHNLTGFACKSTEKACFIPINVYFPSTLHHSASVRASC